MQTLMETIASLPNDPGLSDVHVHGDCPVYLRVNGKMRRLSEDAVCADAVWAFAEYHMTPELKQRWLDDKSVDFSLAYSGCVYRANFYFESQRPAVALRRLTKTVPSLRDLGMPSAVGTALATTSGLMLATGATGSGKSTSLAAMVRYILDTRAVHLLTIEDPVEFAFQSRLSLVSRREIGIDAVSFASALRAAFREDPDVILIGEMRDLETIGLALTAAETGHLVLATLHTSSCAGAVSRIVDVFPAEAREQVRVQLAQSLCMVINQQLTDRADGNGRVAAFEVLFATDAVRNLIRENKTHQLGSVMDTARAQGMVSMRSALASLRAAGTIHEKQANAGVTNAGREALP